MGCGASKHDVGAVAGSGDQQHIAPSTGESAAVTKRTASGNDKMRGGTANQPTAALSSRTTLDLLLSVGALDPIVQVTAHSPLILQPSAVRRDFFLCLFVCNNE
jgi:hypothetical protein